jgi:hypothetical protein
MEQDRQSGEDDHQNQWSRTSMMSLHTNGEETNEAEFSRVDTDRELLEGFGVRSSLSVNTCLQDVEEVVAEDCVEGREGYSREAQG